MNSETIIDVIDALVGNIKPYGATEIDNERMDNLQVLLDVMYYYIEEIDDVARYQNRPEHSMRRMGEIAYDWFADLKEYVDAIMEKYEEKEDEKR